MKATQLLLFILLLSLAACTSAAPAPAPTASAPTVPASPALVPAVATGQPAPVQPASPTVLSSSATATPQAAEPTSAPATTAPSQALVPTPAPSRVTALAAQPVPFSIGVPAGDGYAPYGLAIDPAKNLAYVYHADSVERRPVISVVDLTAGKVTRLLRLNMATPGASGRLLVTPDGKRLFLQENQEYSFLTIDTATGAVRRLLEGVQEAALSNDGRVLYVLQGRGPAAYSTADLLGGKTEPIWRTAGPFARLALNGRQLLAATFDNPATLTTFDTETGQVRATAQAAGSADAVSAGPDGGWAVAVGGEKPRLIRYAANLNSLGETPTLNTSAVTYDAARNRYLLGGSRYSENEPGGHRVIISIDAADGKVLVEQPWLAPGAPGAFAPWGDNSLVGYAPGEAAVLSIMDASSLAPKAQIPTGARTENVALDDAGKRLFVADDLGWTHVLSLPDGKEMAVWEGGWPLAFDGANGRLYVNRGSGVAALDAKTGELLVQFPQRGDPAPDPNADLVYIANRGVTIYDMSGKKLGTLASTFPAPQAFSGNPYGMAVEVNPVTGHVAVVMDNGIPGSNGGSYLRVYERQSDRYAEPRAPFGFVMDLVTGRDGRWYVAYSQSHVQEAVQVLSPDGQQLDRLDHRTGHLALDEGKDELFLLTDGRVTRLKQSTLEAMAVYQGPEYAAQMVYSPTNRTAYVVQFTGPFVTPVNVDALSALDLRPVPGRPAPDAYSDSIAVVANGRQRLVVTRLQEAYRSTDGAAWERLLPDLTLGLGYVTVAAPRTIFISGRSPAGGEGVLRSTDGGDTWAFLAAGLTDLAPAGPVLANSADEAYFANEAQGLLRWDAAQKQWQPVNGNFTPGTWGALSLAPDGALFRSAGGYLERTTDHGFTWEKLGEDIKTGSVIGYSSLYTTTHAIFSVVRTGYRIEGLQRSTDNGRTWQPSITGTPFGFDGYQPEMSSGFGKSYLLLRPYQGSPVLLRTGDYGDTWQQASVEAAAGIDHIAVDPLDGRLWTGVKGGVKAIDPEKLAWGAISGKSTPTSVPTAGARSMSLTPTPGACPRTLTGSDVEINGRGLNIGCPADIDRSIPMARQRFQGGQMIWRQDRRQIYVLYNDGHWQGYEDKWLDTDPPDDPSIVAPSGLQQPVRGFGKVWREKLGGPKAALGWALEKEQGVQGQAQAWDHGTVLRFGGEIIILADSGKWR